MKKKFPTNTERAVAVLKREGLKVTKEEDGRYFVNFGGGSPYFLEYCRYTPAELIRYANGFGKNCKQKTAIKRCVKNESKKERGFVRDKLRIHGEDADVNFPRQTYGDPWSYD